LDTSAIVLGDRGRSALRSRLLGDVANARAQQATRPVLLVPSPELATRRHGELAPDAPRRD
jgi:nucleotide-binding universal stress UspA family protein